MSRQRSSARYFQRPDRDRRSPRGFFTDAFDSTETGMRGYGFYSRFAKDAGNWMWETSVNARSPGFETNDVALQTRADYLWHGANLFRFWSKPGKWYRDFSIIVGGQQQFNYDGDRTDAQAQIFFSSTTPQFWNWNTFYIWRPTVMDDRLLRGGPVVERPGGGFYSANIGTDFRKPIAFNFDFGLSTNSLGGWGTDVGLFVRYRPSSRVSTSVGPSWNTSGSLFQYVTAVKDSTATSFYGSRYIVSGLKQKQLSLETRVNLTFSPTMTFEMFAQPLIASGAYSRYKEFAAPRSRHKLVYGRDIGEVTVQAGTPDTISIDPDGAGGPAASFQIVDPSFTFRSLRGNAVLRWEYRPGST
ncbi:MAG: DUF5916 domain-containing protein, partial [Vicinamibacterales bacterium]